MNNGLKDFIFKILNGMAMGIVVALVPNAMLGEVFKYLATFNPVFNIFTTALMIFQFSLPLLVGVCISHQFKFNGIQTSIVAGSTLLGSGAVVFKDKAFTFVGIGDLINILLVAIISVLIVNYLYHRLGTLTVVILPIIGGLVPGLIGMVTLPYVKLFTGTLGQMVAHFTTLNPLLMSILIAVTYALLMASPISVVAIATVIGLSGLGSGAANLGCTACVYTFIVGSMKVNDKGTNTALIIGASKMMMPVYFKNPIIAVPLLINGIVMGITAYTFNIQGTPASAGFSYTGLVGPINALKFMEGNFTTNVLILLVCYIVIPLTSAVLVHSTMRKFVPVYKKEIYKFNI
ncbi:PTS transporter subunit IIC [Macrococcus sp. DPC7161]|uniref:PTS transporter subunit IIC n=1 Tax=Macrococcus sp. DPC7161 TaxID=2507060 RepID=UPI002104E29F|nr:PTS sugar transporter subunit IIC [Macrococcus sp. DPC7161]